MSREVPQEEERHRDEDRGVLDDLWDWLDRLFPRRPELTPERPQPQPAPPPRPMPPPRPSPPPVTLPPLPGTIQFDYNRSGLAPSEDNKLQYLAHYLISHPVGMVAKSLDLLMSSRSPHVRIL